MILTKNFRRGRIVTVMRRTESSKVFRELRKNLSLRQVAEWTNGNGVRGINYESWRRIESGEKIPTPADVRAAAALPWAPAREVIAAAAVRDHQRLAEETYAPS